MTGRWLVSCGGGAASSLLVGWGVLGASRLGGVVLVCGLGGLGVLLLAVGFPCPLAPC